MKTIATVLVLFFGIVVNCYGLGDPVSAITKDKNTETTTFRRDSERILESILYHATEPEKRILRQQVIFKDEVVVELVDFQGKRSFLIHPRSHVVVGIQQDSKTGALESVGLMDDSKSIIEVFEVKDSRLTPISGKQLELNRAFTKDVSGLLAPENVKKTNPKEFGNRVKGMLEKYKTDESAHQKENRSK